MKDNIILEKSFAFSIRIIHLSRYLQHETKDYVLSKQILRSGTSIGANIEEAVGGISKKEFAARLPISYKKQERQSIGCGYLEKQEALTTISRSL